jgi:hypothetical protein
MTMEQERPEGRNPIETSMADTLDEVSRELRTKLEKQELHAGDFERAYEMNATADDLLNRLQLIPAGDEDRPLFEEVSKAAKDTYEEILRMFMERHGGTYREIEDLATRLREALDAIEKLQSTEERRAAFREPGYKALEDRWLALIDQIPRGFPDPQRYRELEDMDRKIARSPFDFGTVRDIAVDTRGRVEALGPEFKWWGT